MTPTLDPREVSAASFLVIQECRRADRHWDPQGIHAAVQAALVDDGRRPDAVVSAGFAAVHDTNARTPGAIRWAARYPDEAPAESAAAARLPSCFTCGRPESQCRTAAAKSGDPHQFQHERRTP